MHYPAEFPYYPQYCYFNNNCMSKNTYNAGLTQQQQKPSAGISQTGVGLASTKQSGRKIKESAGGSSIMSNSLLSSSSQNATLSALGGNDRNEPRDPEQFKQQMIQWLKSLDIDQRFEVFLVKDKWFAQTIVKMFWKQKLGGDSGFALYTEEDKKERNLNHNGTISELEQQFYCRRWLEHDSTSASARARKKAEQEIVNALRVLDDKELYDSLAFDKDYLDTSIEQLIHSFDLVSNHNLFATSHLSHYSWFNPRTFQTIPAWIVSSFEKILQQKFLEDRSRFNSKAMRIALTQEQQQVSFEGKNISGSSNLHTGSKISAISPGVSQNALSNHQEISSMQANTTSNKPQSQSRSRSYQKDTNHYDNLLRYWRSLSESKRKKVLQICSEINRELETKSSITNNSSTGSRNGKHNPSNQVVLEQEYEWYRKVRETFYLTKDQSNNNSNNSSSGHAHNNSNSLHSTNTSSNILNPNLPIQSLFPSDDDILNEVMAYSDDLMCESFISSLCFTALSQTASLTTLVLKEIHVKLNEMYAESIQQSLILHDELDKKKRTQQLQQQPVHSSSAGVPPAQALKKKNKKGTNSSSNNNNKNDNSSSHSNILNQKKTKGESVAAVTAMGMIMQQQQSSTNHLHPHNHSHGNKNNKGNSNSNNKNKKDIKSFISSCSAGSKEPSFAEEVRLMYEQEQREEREAKQREIDMKAAAERERLEQAEKEKQLELLIESKTNKTVKDKKKKGKGSNSNSNSNSGGDKKQEEDEKEKNKALLVENLQQKEKGNNNNNNHNMPSAGSSSTGKGKDKEQGLNQKEHNKAKNCVTIVTPIDVTAVNAAADKAIHQENRQTASKPIKVEKGNNTSVTTCSKNTMHTNGKILEQTHGQATQRDHGKEGKDQEQKIQKGMKNANQTVACCDTALRCEMAEISRAIVIKLIQQCVAGLEEQHPNQKLHEHKENHINHDHEENKATTQDQKNSNQAKEAGDDVVAADEDSNVHLISQGRQDVQLSSIPKTKKKSKSKKKSNGNKNDQKVQQEEQDLLSEQQKEDTQNSFQKQSTLEDTVTTVAEDKQSTELAEKMIAEKEEDKEEQHNIIDHNQNTHKNNSHIPAAVVAKTTYLSSDSYTAQHDDDSDFIQVGTKKKNKPAQIFQQSSSSQASNGTAMSNANSSGKHKNNSNNNSHRKIGQANPPKTNGFTHPSQTNHGSNKQKTEGEQTVSSKNPRNNEYATPNQGKNANIPHSNNYKNDAKQTNKNSNISGKKDNVGNSTGSNNTKSTASQPQSSSKRIQPFQSEQSEGDDHNKYASLEGIQDNVKGKQQPQPQQQYQQLNNRSNKHIVSNQGDRGCVVVLSSNQNNNYNNNKSTASSLSHSSSSHVPMLNTIDLHRDCEDQEDDDGDESDSQQNYIQKNSRRNNGLEDNNDSSKKAEKKNNQFYVARLPNSSMKASLSPSSCSSFASINSHELHSYGSTARVSIKNNNDSSPKANSNNNNNSNIKFTQNHTVLPFTKNTSSPSKTLNKTLQEEQPQQQQQSSLPSQQQGPTVLASKLKAKIAKRLFKKKITHDIVSFSERINSESHRYAPSRQRIFLRIQKILKQLYSGQDVDVRIFGSCATGLSLPTSDIDLGIAGFERNSKRELIGVLGNLADVLESFSWVKSVERIFTASIPIIKIVGCYDRLSECLICLFWLVFQEVDPSVEFSARSGGKQYEELNKLIEDSYYEDSYFELNMPFSEDTPNDLQGMRLKVDITAECQVSSATSASSEKLNHLGVLSTDFVTRWMSYYTKLQPMTILMKCFLYTRNLNTNFKGGISSYSLLIMIIAFFRDNQSIAQSDDFSNILMSFLKFYGCQFNPENTGVSLVNQNPFFSVVRTPGQSKLQVIDPLMGKLLTSNTYLIDEILKEFEGFHKTLIEFSKKCEKQLDKLNAQDLLFIDSVSYSELVIEMKKQSEQSNSSDNKSQNGIYQRNFRDLREFLLPNQIESVIYEVDEQKHEFFDRVFKAQQSQSSYGIGSWFDASRNKNPFNNELSQSSPNKNIQQYKDM